MYPLWVWLLPIILSQMQAIPDAMFVNINPKKAAHVLDEHFVSLTINPTELLQGRPFGTDLNSTLKILKGLSPAYVRLGGPDTNLYTFLNAPNDDGQSQENNIIITGEHWKSFNELMEQAGIDVIACLNSDLSADGSNKWDSRNALELITFSDKEHLNITWELGYEYARDHSVSGIQVGKDIAQLRTILNAFPRYQSSRLVGPDLTSLTKREDVEHVLNILSEGGPSLDAITWHPRWPHVGTIQPEDLSADGYEFPPDYLEWDKHHLTRIMQRTLLKKPLWISQPASENTGSFAEGLILARRLALAAKLGIEVVMKQPNLNDISHPKPEYWVAVLHKKILGRTILDTRPFGNESDVSIITHCTSNLFPRKKNGGISIYMVNTGSSPHKAIIRGAFSDKPEGERVFQYILTASGNEDSIFSEKSYLNGEQLLLDDNGDLPVFAPRVKRLRQNMILKLPPYSVGFWVIPQAKAQICQEEPHQSFAPLLEGSEVSKVLNTAQKGINDLRDINHMIVEKLLPSIGIIPVKEGTEDNLLGSVELTNEELKRPNRDVDLDEWEKDLRKQLGEINNIMDGEVRRRRSGGKSASAMLLAEEKINNLASDLSKFIEKADQQREFGMFLEKAGLKQDFGKLMVDDRLDRKNRKPVVLGDEDQSSEERRKRDYHHKEEDDDPLGLKNFKNQLALAQAGHNKLKPHPNGLRNSGIDVLNKELREDLLLREIVLLEKAEETFADAIKNHKKSHESTDKKIRNEIANLKDEKIATLLEMKYDSKPPPIDKIGLMNSHIHEQTEKTHALPILSKRLKELRSDVTRQSHTKRETRQKTNILVSAEDENKKDDPFEELRRFLNRHRERQASVHEIITEMKNAKLKVNEKKTTAPPVKTSASDESILAVTTPTVLKTTEEEVLITPKSSPDVKEQHLVASPKNIVSHIDTSEGLLSKIKSTLRKTRKIDEVSPETVGDINILPSDGKIPEMDSEKITESTPKSAEVGGPISIFEKSNMQNEKNHAMPPLSSQEIGGGISGSSEDREGRQFQRETKGNDFVSSWENKVDSIEFGGGSAIDRKSEKTSEAERSFEGKNADVIKQSTTEYDASASSSKPSAENPSASATEIESADWRRVRRDASIPEASRPNSTDSGTKVDGNGEGNSKNAIMKRRKINGDANLKSNDVLNLAGSTVEVVLDDVIPETYDQAVLKLEHLILPDYLKNLANVIEDLKVLQKIFTSLGGAATNSLASSSNNIQKITRKKREVNDLEGQVVDEEKKEKALEKDDEEKKVVIKALKKDDEELKSLGDSEQVLDLVEKSEPAVDDAITKEAENLLTDSILHEVMEEVAREVLKSEEEDKAIYSSTTESSSVVTVTEYLETQNKIPTATKSSPKSKVPDSVAHEERESPSANNINASVDEDPSTPWLSSTQDIIEHVIKNLMKKQELEERSGKGKREIADPGFLLQQSYKKTINNQPFQNESPPMAESVNQFLRQLQPGVYVVPSKDMTNVHADQVAREVEPSSSDKNSPNVVTLNIYYDKKNPQDGREENTVTTEFKQPSTSDPISPSQNYPLWPSPSSYKAPLPAPHSLPLPPPLSAPGTLLPQPVLSPRKQYESRYSRPFKPVSASKTSPYVGNPLNSYDPSYQVPRQPKYDESYSLISQEPSKGDYKLIPVTNFAPWTSKELPVEGNFPEIKWNSLGYNQPSPASEALPSFETQNPKSGDNGRAWYQQKAMMEPPLFVKKEIKKQSKKIASNPPVSANNKARSIEPYWNRTLKEIFEETANEPFWNFLKEPEDSYSNYKSAEDNLDNFMSGEDSGIRNGDNKDVSNSSIRKKRSLMDNGITKLSKRNVPFMATVPVKRSIYQDRENRDTETGQPDFYVTGRVIEFNGSPGDRFRRDYGRMSNDIPYKIKNPQRLPLDSNRINHGVMPRKMFDKPKQEESFDIEDETFLLNGNIPSVIQPALEQLELKYEPTQSEVINPFAVKSDEWPLQQFYDFGMQILKGVTGYM